MDYPLQGAADDPNCSGTDSSADALYQTFQVF